MANRLFSASLISLILITVLNIGKTHVYPGIPIQNTESSVTKSIPSDFILDTLRGCNKIEWASWSRKSTYEFIGTYKAGGLVSIEADRTSAIPIPLLSLEFNSQVLIPKIVPNMPVIFMSGNSTKLTHKITLDPKYISDYLLYIASVTNSNHGFSDIQHTKISAYDLQNNRLDVSGVKLECEDPTIYFISPTHLDITAFEIDLYVDQPGSLDDGDVLIFSNLPMNTAYLLIEHQDDFSFTWDGIYINVGLPDCCPATSHTTQVIPCTGNPNTYTLEGIVDLLPSNPNDSFFLFVDSIPWVRLAHPFDRISWKISGLSPDGATHVIRYFTKDAPDCIQTIQFIAPIPPVPPVLQSNSPLCEEDTLMLFSSPAMMYNWNGPDHFSSTYQNPILTKINPNQSGTYTVTVTDVQGCTASASIDVTVTKSNRISFAATGCDSVVVNGKTYYSSGMYQQVFQNILGCDSIMDLDVVINYTSAVLDAGKDTSLCEGSGVELQGMYSGDAKFNWQSANGLFDRADSLQTNYFPGGPGAYKVYLTSQNDCINLIDSLLVKVLPNQILNIVGDPIIDPCHEITFTANGGTKYTWSPSEYIECLDSLCSKIRLKSFVEFTLTLNADGPCVIPAQLSLSLSALEAGLFVPNAFTPNGDQINDIFLPIIFCEELQYYHLEIFDRWGNLVFQSFEKDLGWDGRFNSEKMNPAVFVYVIEYQIRGYGKNIKAGDVTLVK